MTYIIESRHATDPQPWHHGETFLSYLNTEKKKTIIKLKPLKRIELKSDALIQKRNNETFLEIKDFLCNYFLWKKKKNLWR